MDESNRWLRWAVELQSIAQAGLYYGRDAYDRERYQRVRDIALEMVAHKADVPPGKVRDLFCGDTGYQTPKVDVRAAVVEGGRVLLVRETSGLWALPGGWADVGLTLRENVRKEAREEAGLEVVCRRLIAVQDREKHNAPPHAFHIYKLFVLCDAVGGRFAPNVETTESGFFAPDALPPLCEDKTTAAQARMCVEAADDADWRTVFD